MAGGKVQSVYGGGNKGGVTGSTEVAIGTGAPVTSSVYGGSSEANVTGTATVTISDTAGTVYGLSLIHI